MDAVWVKKNAPQIYQRLIDNALYGYLKIDADTDAFSMESSKRVDVFTEGELDTSQTPSVISRRSFIDDILIRATSWTALYEIVEIATFMRQVEFVDPPGQKALRKA